MTMAQSMRLVSSRLFIFSIKKYIELEGRAFVERINDDLGDNDHCLSIFQILKVAFFTVKFT